MADIVLRRSPIATAVTSSDTESGQPLGALTNGEPAPILAPGNRWSAASASAGASSAFLAILFCRCATRLVVGFADRCQSLGRRHARLLCGFRCDRGHAALNEMLRDAFSSSPPHRGQRFEPRFGSAGKQRVWSLAICFCCVAGTPCGRRSTCEEQQTSMFYA